MKILIVCQYFSPEPFRITEIANELYKRGHLVDVLTGIPNYPEGHFYKGYGITKNYKELFNGVKIIRVPIIPRGNGNSIVLALNYISFAITGSLRALIFQKKSYDVILVYQLSPVMMAIPGVITSLHLCIPMVLYVADLWPESLSAVKGTKSKVILKFVGWIVDQIYRKSKKILVTSKGFIKSITLRGQPLGKLIYVPQFPEDIFHPLTVEKDNPIRKEMPKGFTIIFTGNVGVAQGLEVVLEAALKLFSYNEINWVIIGDGRARKKLEKKSISCGLNQRIHFFGRRPMSCIPVYLALSDVALICLKQDPVFELTLPAKIQSYFACGIPIIGSIDGNAANIILESGAGLVGSAGDANALVENVLTLYRSSLESRTKYRLNALRYYKKYYSKDLLMSKIEYILYQAMLSKK